MTRYVDVGDPLTDDLTGDPLELSREELGHQTWHMWLAGLTIGCTPAEFAAALVHGGDKPGHRSAVLMASAAE